MSGYLFLDTTTNNIVCLLDGHFNRLEWDILGPKEASNTIHAHINDKLRKHAYKPDAQLVVITCAGPGSYTGLRLAEGIGQVFGWAGIKHLSFYHFNLPALLGRTNYVFISRAYKGEYFVFRNDSGQRDFHRFPKTEIVENLEKYKNQILFVESEQTAQEINPGREYIVMADFLEKNISNIVEKIVRDKSKEELFYYRPAEEEFIPSNK